jgi:ATP-dependent protease ClpP protease subunit
MTKMNNDEMTIQPVQPNNLFVTETPEGNIFDLYLVGEIGHPEQYVEVCHALRLSEANDIFIIHINSEGGQVRSGLMLINAIKEAQCHVVGVIEQICYSMGSGIFLACDSFQVNPYSELMIHTSHSGAVGKENDLFANVEFSRKQTHRQIRETYSHFLTEEEIEDVIKGSDLYFNAEEIEQRLETYAEYRAELAKEAEGDAGGPQDLTEIVSEAVERTLVKHGLISDDSEDYEDIELPEGVEEKLKEDSEKAVVIDLRDDVQKDLDAQIEKAAMELEELLAEQEKSEE